MSNNYYAGNVIYNNQHKELTIQGNLSAQQMMKIAKDFFAEDTEVTEENYEAEVTGKASETNEAAGEGFQILCILHSMKTMDGKCIKRWRDW
ncbi:hypothetical protein F7D19_08390 [Prevotella copri]|nr:hypothetical protein [Segatella copri]